MPHAFTEDQLCEQPALALLAELGWRTASAVEETFGPGGTLGRETPGRLTEESKEAYYETLNRSSQHWHEGCHELTPWMNLFLAIIPRGYAEFEAA